jgi:hypothetical protein
LKPVPTDVSGSLALESLLTMPLDLVDRRSGGLSSGAGSGVDSPSAASTVNSATDSSSKAWLWFATLGKRVRFAG